MHALRPAFRELGLTAAAIYEALETSSDPQSSFELAQAAGISRSAAYEALETLAGWNLISPDRRGRWVLVQATCRDRLAEAWGVLDTIRVLITRHRGERANYRRALRIPDLPYADIALADWTAGAPPGLPTPALAASPPDVFEAALMLLRRELGGVCLPGHSS